MHLGNNNTNRPHRKITPFVLLITLLKIWDTKNVKVFRHVDLSTPHVIENFINDPTLWTDRFKTANDKAPARMWRGYLTSR
jgi:hypothetical protein